MCICPHCGNDTDKPPVQTGEFEQFWEMYGYKQGRKKCEVKWKRLSQEDKKRIFAVLPAYIESTPDRQYRKHPYTWLNGECWNDEIVLGYSRLERNMQTVQGALCPEQQTNLLLKHF